ncbi:hypothetical protein K1T71_013891 [Dendrolimus kikuchii]|uniref:Uncharacterized protein n=1 Tax=Dendrolimus kikuchii TaxID=765133 RepID=A0ACC1CG11_9NEOP|nr:hypothetical protein K1T71_013891 [Dendrolimus kikuchii]
MIKAYIAFVTLWFSILLTAIDGINQIMPKPELKDDKAKHHFKELLNSLLSLNEKRMKTIKKIANLENENIGKHILRAIDIEERSDESDKPILIVLSQTLPSDSEHDDETRNDLTELIANLQRKGLSIEVNDSAKHKHNNPKSKILSTSLKSKKEIKVDSDDQEDDDDGNDKNEDDEITVESDESADDTRLRYRGCGKRATKDCRKACIEAMKDSCDQYSCRRKMKRYFRKRCRRSCKDRFK